MSDPTFKEAMEKIRNSDAGKKYINTALEERMPDDMVFVLMEERKKLGLSGGAGLNAILAFSIGWFDVEDAIEGPLGEEGSDLYEVLTSALAAQYFKTMDAARSWVMSKYGEKAAYDVTCFLEDDGYIYD